LVNQHVARLEPLSAECADRPRDELDKRAQVDRLRERLDSSAQVAIEQRTREVGARLDIRRVRATTQRGGHFFGRGQHCVANHFEPNRVEVIHRVRPTTIERMRISDIKTFLIAGPGHNMILVKIETDEGLYGIGEGSLAGRDQGVLGVMQHLKPLLIGRDPSRVEDIWQECYRNTFWRGGPVLLSAISGIDIALWDLKGKRLGVPVYDLLGGKTRDQVRVYTHLNGAIDDELCERALEKIEQGYTALRFVPALFNAQPWDADKSVRATVRTFEKLRHAVGEDIDLMIDVHHRFTPMQNVRLGQAIQAYAPFFIEDPIPPDNLQSYALMRSKIDVPLATGEAMVTKWSFKYLIENELIDYLRVDPVHAGGITETKKIAVMGEVHSIDLALHNPSSPVCAATCIHLDASVLNFGIQESVGQSDVMREIFPVQPEIVRGYFEVSDRPGLGLEFDEAAAVMHTTTRLTELPHLRRADGSVTDW